MDLMGVFDWHVVIFINTVYIYIYLYICGIPWVRRQFYEYLIGIQLVC